MRGASLPTSIPSLLKVLVMAIVAAGSCDEGRVHGFMRWAVDSVADSSNPKHSRLLGAVFDAALAKYPTALSPVDCVQTMRVLLRDEDCPDGDWQVDVQGDALHRLGAFASILARSAHTASEAAAKAAVSPPENEALALNASELRPPLPLRVLVVGAGPAGLMHAVSAALLARGVRAAAKTAARVDAAYGRLRSHKNMIDNERIMTVSVVEKRDQWQRDTWFDLMPESSDPDSLTMKYLRQWGFNELRPALQLQEHPGTPILSIRCEVLERFLARVLLAVGAPVMRGREFVTIGGCQAAALEHMVLTVSSGISLDNTDAQRLICNATAVAATQGIVKQHAFDVLIGADGSKSSVRAAAKLGWTPQHRVMTAAGRASGTFDDVPNLSQATLIVDFHPTDRGDCPDLRVNPVTGKVIDPFEPGFHVRGVTSVFKRFFHGYCQLQLLFARDLGEKWMHNGPGQSPATPWSILLAIANLLLAPLSPSPESVRFRSERDLREAVLRTSGVFRIRIYRASRAAVVLHGTADTASTSGIVADVSAAGFVDDVSRLEGRRPAAVLLVGDSAVTAHYRLGIGVNNAFKSLPELAPLLHAALYTSQSTQHSLMQNRWAQFARAVQVKELAASHRIDEMVQFQLAAMYHESHCGLIVFGEELFQRQRLPDGSFSYQELDNDAAAIACSVAISE